MKKYGKYLILAGIAGLGFLFAYLSAAAWGGMCLAKDSIMFYLENPLSVEEALAVTEQNQEIAELYRQGQTEQGAPFNFCIWGQKENIIVSNEELSRSAKTDLILLCGNPEFLFEDCRQPVQEDTQGCLVDEKTAWDLFGSVQVIGKEVSCEGKNYMIRNVVPGKEGILAFQAGNALVPKGGQQEGADSSQFMDEVLQRVTLQRPEGYSIQDLEYGWSGRYGVAVDLLDIELLRGIGGFCVLLFPVSLCVIFWMYLYRQYKNQKTPQGKAVAAGLSLALAVLLLFFLKGRVEIPDDYIPTRWSEFSFWATLWERKVETVKILLRMPKTNLDGVWMNDFFKVAGYGVFAEVFLVIAGVISVRKQMIDMDFLL